MSEKLYTLEQIAAMDIDELEDACIGAGVYTADMTPLAMIEALKEVEKPEEPLQVTQVAVNVGLTSPNGVIFSCGGSSAPANVTTGLVGKTLGVAIEMMREVVNVPTSGRRVVFLNGLMQTDMNVVLKAGDNVDVTEPASTKG